jgi:hypothetical protein
MIHEHSSGGGHSKPMHEHASGGHAKPRFKLRPKHREEPLTMETPRFHVFLVDTGWNGPVSKVLHENVPLFHHYYPQDPVYVLTKEQSVKLLKRAPECIGHDPMVLMYDIYTPKGAHAKEKANYHGFRLNLGVIKNPQQALAKLQEFLKFVTKNRTAECLSCEVQRELHREGLSNMVNILREASEASLELL